MELNDIIKLPDGRIGTLVYHNLDGDGGVWGKHTFQMPDGGFGDELPAPDFMLREKSIEKSLQKWGHKPDMECVGEECELITTGDSE